MYPKLIQIGGIAVSSCQSLPVMAFGRKGRIPGAP